MGNNAIADNPPSYDEDITVRGSDWLWAVFALMVTTGLGVTVLAYAAPIGKRAFHWISVAILFTASVAYFSMASNLGSTPVKVEFTRYKSDLWTGGGDPYRAIWYARYIDWVITTPLLLLDLLLATGLPLSTIFFTVFMDEVMIITGLIGALVVSQYKWGYFLYIKHYFSIAQTFATGCVAMLYVFMTLIGPARTAAKALGPDAGSVYTKSAALLAGLWFLYPIAWGLSDGGNVISPDSEMVFYGVLDVLAKPGFILFHLFALRNIEYERFQLQSGHYSTGASDANYASNKNVPFVKMSQAPTANGTAANGVANPRNSTATAVA